MRTLHPFYLKNFATILQVGYPLAGVSQKDIIEKLGFTVQDLNEELSRQLDYTAKQGVIISQVASGIPDQFAGLKPGILILEVNRKGFMNVQEFLEAIGVSKSLLLLFQEGQYSPRYVNLKMD